MTVAEAVLKSVSVELPAIGTVQAYATVAVRSRVAGQVTQVAFEKGQDVKKGDLLFTIDARPFAALVAQAKANLARDVVNHKNAELELARALKLYKLNAVSEEEYQQFVARVDALRATVEADQAAVEAAAVSLDYTEIRSPLVTEVRSVAPSAFTVKIDPALVATQDEVASVIGKGSVRLLDARPAPYFFGETRHAAAKTPGTLVGAKNVDQAVWFADGSGALLPAADVQRIAQDNGVQTDQPTVSFCNTGHWAATNWFVLSEVLGQKDVKLYPESTVGWSQAGLPMTNVPTRLAQFWLQLKEATGNL